MAAEMTFTECQKKGNVMKRILALLLAMCMTCVAVGANAASEKAVTSLGHILINENGAYTITEDLENGGIPVATITGELEGVEFMALFTLYPERINSVILESGDFKARQQANYYTLIHMLDMSYLEDVLKPEVNNPFGNIYDVEGSFGHYVDGDIEFVYTASRYFPDAGVGVFVMAKSAELGDASIAVTRLILNVQAADEAKLAPIREAAAEIAAEASNWVVITADSGKIRTEASISGGLIKTAYKGETFELIREEGDWYVVDVHGRTGYIHKGVAALQ